MRRSEKEQETASENVLGGFEESKVLASFDVTRSLLLWGGYMDDGSVV